MSDEITEIKPSRPLLISMFLRSFLFGALMNFTRMLGLSFGLGMIPVARELKLKGESLAAFLRRSLDFFNAHPYLATFALGAVGRLEMEGEEPQRITSLKTRIMGPLGLFGDQIFWSRFKPMMAALTILLLVSVNWPPGFNHRLTNLLIITAFFIVYNAVHFIVRWRGLTLGFKSGDSVLKVITASRLVKYRMHLSFAAAVIGGVFAVRALEFSQNSTVFSVSFIAALVGLRMKSPLWIVILFAFAVSLGVSLYIGTKLSG
ncbi:MAG: PTS system mannose/fructose/sorbose family transporter subunit IID [candidate division Zixibacteria bacterium]|nr:PTS system mannose/fructose/sorbose family transporter subunit IID [Candidatus Tariuqbacter arcticus]